MKYGVFLDIFIIVSFSKTSVLHGLSKDISKLQFPAADKLAGRALYKNVCNFRIIEIGVSQFEIYTEFA
jgi:hypothetical protein